MIGVCALIGLPSAPWQASQAFSLASSSCACAGATTSASIMAAPHAKDETRLNMAKPALPLVVPGWHRWAVAQDVALGMTRKRPPRKPLGVHRNSGLPKQCREDAA